MSAAAAIARAYRGRHVGQGWWLVRCPCAGHGKGHGDRHPSLSIRDGDDGGLVPVCKAGCDWRDVRDEFRRQGFDVGGYRGYAPVKLPLVRTPALDWVDDEPARIAKARRYWNEARDPRGTVVERYLAGRGLPIASDIAGQVLRFHPALPWRDDTITRGWVPVLAMLAAMRSVRTDALVGIHVTALNADGRKLEPTVLADDGDGRKRSSKRMRGQATGVAIKLDADEEVTQGLTIAEGIETALSARLLGFRPVWAVGSRSGIATFPVLAGIDGLTILRETDDGGVNINASVACAERWSDAGVEVLFATPKIVGDIDDVRSALRRAAS